MQLVGANFIDQNTHRLAGPIAPSLSMQLIISRMLIKGAKISLYSVNFFIADGQLKLIHFLENVSNFKFPIQSLGYYYSIELIVHA